MHLVFLTLETMKKSPDTFVAGSIAIDYEVSFSIGKLAPRRIQT